MINANGGVLLRLLKLLITLHSSPVLSIFCICRALEESILCPGTIEMIQDMIYVSVPADQRFATNYMYVACMASVVMPRFSEIR